MPFKNSKGLRDVLAGLKNIKLPLYLAYSDIRQRYRRSSLGPFWITISMGVTIACIGLIFGNLFKTPMEEFLPFLSCGLILWGLISSVINEATVVFPNSQGIIRQLPLPLFIHIERMILRNFNIFLHNLIVLPFVYIFVGKSINANLLLFPFGLFILLVNLGWLSLCLSVICARFRDLTQIVGSVLQILFYVTPIIWMPSLLPSRSSVILLEPNPFFHLIEIVRAPLLGTTPSLSNILWSLCYAILGWIFSIFFFNKYRDRVAFWL